MAKSRDPGPGRLGVPDDEAVQVAELLCDRHPPDRFAVRYPTSRDDAGKLTYRELRERIVSAPSKSRALR